jgi:hypothetical protein
LIKLIARNYSGKQNFDTKEKDVEIIRKRKREKALYIMQFFILENLRMYRTFLKTIRKL